MPFIWPKPKTINDLRSIQPSLSKSTKLTDRRSVRIGVIDNEPFMPEQTLRQLGYDVTFLGNINAFSQVAGFQIILCDLKGVFAESALQEASLIKQIRASYPQIYVIAYSGAHPSSLLYRSASEFADEMFEKIADVDKWTDLLDTYVGKCCQASEFWQRFRLHLAEKGIDAIQLMILEDAFVRAVLKRDASIFSNAVGGIELPEGVKPIIEGVTSHLIAHTLITAL